MEEQKTRNEKLWKIIDPGVSYFKRNLGILIALLLMMAIVSCLSNNFLKGSNLLNILRQISTNTFLSFGMLFVILIGGIDLSVGSLVAFSGVMVAYGLGVWHLPLFLAVLISLVLSTLVGVFNGGIVSKTGIHPFVVTLATETIFRGVAMLIAKGAPIRITNKQFIKFGTSYLGPVAYPIIYAFIIMFICFVLLNRTKFGRHMYAIGGNRVAAKFAGINIDRTETMVYTISAFLAGLAGIVLASRMTAGVPAAGTGYELDAIAAVVLGGASFTGGVGTVGGTLIGAIIIGVIANGLNMLNVASFWQYIVKGIVILLAVLIDVLRKKRKTQLDVKKIKGED